MARRCIPVFLLGLFFFIAGSSFAQQPGGRPPAPPSASDIVANMQKTLHLTDEQVARITPIIQKEVTEMEKLMKQTMDRDQAATRMNTLRQQIEAELRQCLTEEQLAQWRNMQRGPSQGRDDSTDSMGPGGRGRSGGRR